MKLTDEDLEQIYAVANQIFYGGELPTIPVFLEDMGGLDYGGHTYGALYDDALLNLNIGINNDSVLASYEADAGDGRYSAYLIRTMLHEMVHVFFAVSGKSGKDGGSRITGEPHTAAYAEVANAHGLHVYYDPNNIFEPTDNGEAEYIPDETARLFAEHGIIIDMGDEHEAATYADEECFNTLEELQRYMQEEEDANR